jgi:hypothetical protein
MLDTTLSRRKALLIGATGAVSHYQIKNSTGD